MHGNTSYSNTFLIDVELYFIIIANFSFHLKHRLTPLIFLCIARDEHAVADPAPKSGQLLPPEFRDRAILRPVEVYRVLGVGSALAWKLINYLRLERTQLGPRAVGVTRASVERLIASGAPMNATRFDGLWRD